MFFSKQVGLRIFFNKPCLLHYDGLQEFSLFYHWLDALLQMKCEPSSARSSTRDPVENSS